MTQSEGGDIKDGPYKAGTIYVIPACEKIFWWRAANVRPCAISANPTRGIRPHLAPRRIHFPISDSLGCQDVWIYTVRAPEAVLTLFALAAGSSCS